jgi:hypothetical protein
LLLPTRCLLARVRRLLHCLPVPFLLLRSISLPLPLLRLLLFPLRRCLPRKLPATLIPALLLFGLALILVRMALHCIRRHNRSEKHNRRDACRSHQSHQISVNLIDDKHVEHQRT